MYKFALKVFGCQMNQYDADKIRTALMARGAVESPAEEADFVIYIGCSIRDKAEHKVWSELGRYYERWEEERKPYIAMTGCIAQNVGSEMAKRFPWVRLVSGPRHIGMLPDGIDRVLKTGHRVTLLDDDPRELHELGFAPLERDCSFKSMVMISHGCDNFCTYCIVPHVRGRFASRAPGEIISEVKQLIATGAKEICLLGQNVDTYGTDLENYTFANLLHDVAVLPGLERLRFMTSYPTDFTEDVVRAIAEHDNLCASINLPIQSGSDRVLRAMNRHYNFQEYVETVDCIRSGLPEVGLTSDLIVGFPGETEEEFQESMEALRRFRFDQVHTAAYSPRQGTPAAVMKNQIPEPEKKRRLNLVNDLQMQIAGEINSEKVGRTYRVLVDGRALKGNLLQGRNEFDKVILFEGDESLVGEFVDVKVTSSDNWSLKGEIV